LPEKARRHSDYRVGDVAGRGRAAVLVGAEGQFVPLRCQPQRGLKHIGAEAPIDPGGAQDDVTRVRQSHRGLAGRLRAPVDAERPIMPPSAYEAAPLTGSDFLAEQPRRITARKVDRSRQRHAVSLNPGQPRAAPIPEVPINRAAGEDSEKLVLPVLQGNHPIIPDGEQ